MLKVVSHLLPFNFFSLLKQQSIMLEQLQYFSSIAMIDIIYTYSVKFLLCLFSYMFPSLPYTLTP